MYLVGSGPVVCFHDEGFLFFGDEVGEYSKAWCWKGGENGCHDVSGVAGLDV